MGSQTVSKTLGASHQTVGRALGGPNGPSHHEKPSNINAGDGEPGPNGPPPLSGTAAARMVARRETGKLARITKVKADEERAGHSFNGSPVRTLRTDAAAFCFPLQGGLRQFAAVAAVCRISTYASSAASGQCGSPPYLWGPPNYRRNLRGLSQTRRKQLFLRQSLGCAFGGRDYGEYLPALFFPCPADLGCLYRGHAMGGACHHTEAFARRGDFLGRFDYKVFPADNAG
jgi:hypothetical protein